MELVLVVLTQCPTNLVFNLVWRKMDKKSLEIVNGLGAGTERIDAHSHIIFAEQAAKYAQYFKKVKDDDVDCFKCFSNYLHMIKY